MKARHTTPNAFIWSVNRSISFASITIATYKSIQEHRVDHPPPSLSIHSTTLCLSISGRSRSFSLSFHTAHRNQTPFSVYIRRRLDVCELRWESHQKRRKKTAECHAIYRLNYLIIVLCVPMCLFASIIREITDLQRYTFSVKFCRFWFKTIENKNRCFAATKSDTYVKKCI